MTDTDTKNFKMGRYKQGFTELSFELETPLERSVQLGLVTLETDLTIETELHHFIGDAHFVTNTGVDTRWSYPTIMHTRIACDDQVTKENLTAMKLRFSDALALFPPFHRFDVIGYGCTSASLLIGEDTINSIVKSRVKVDHVTTPLTGARRALACIGAKNIIYIAPYLSEISETMCQKFEEYGFRIVGAGTFGEEKDSIVGQISPQSIKDAILQLISSCSDSVDAIFVACTSMKCAPIINEVEQELGVSVISSNSAISWDMARLSGLKFSKKQKGALFKQN